MKNSTTLFFAILFFSVNGFAQYLPIGAQWYYGTTDPLGLSTVSFYKYECKKDTLINGDHYSKITFTDDKGNNPPNINYFITQQNSKIFYWFKNSKKLLFDLNTQLGDTINLDFYFPQIYQNGLYVDTSYNLNAKVTQITWVKNYLSGNDSLKKFNMYLLPGQNPIGISGYSAFTEKLVNTNSVTSNSLIYLNCATIPEGGNYLRCYQDTSYNFKSQSGLGRACDYQNVGIDEVYVNNNFKIYPNPATNELHIETTGTEKIIIQLFDVAGKKVVEDFSLSNSTIINLEAIKQGLYFIRLNDSNNHLIQTQKISVIR